MIKIDFSIDIPQSVIGMHSFVFYNTPTGSVPIDWGDYLLPKT
jgi:hypothetical protein